VNIWYSVSDLDAARDFYTRRLGFEEVYVDEEDRWVRVRRGALELQLAEGEGEASEAVAAIDVPDLRAEAERLRAAGVQVGVVVEIPGTIRLLDIYDPDGNRVQLTQDI
jgi:catechol 2,3-dioxygenase-like lactoylglutathione lyase family enzyme